MTLRFVAREALARCSCARISCEMSRFGFVYHAVLVAVKNLNRNLFKNQG